MREENDARMPLSLMGLNAKFFEIFLIELNRLIKKTL